MKPNKVNGKTEQQRMKMCEGKHRWPDELSATAGALRALERPYDTPTRLWTYHCPLCNGWHLTKHPQAGVPPITL